MKRSWLVEAMTALGNRFKAATVGFGITVAPLGIVAVAQFVLAPQIIGTIEGVDNNELALVVSSWRRGWLPLHAIAATLIAVYWLLTAVIGRGQLLQSRAANVTLALFVFVVIAFVLYGSFVQMPEDLTGVCPILGISDTDAPPYGLDTPSSCGAFAHAAHTIMLLAMLGLMLLLLAASVIVRIASSRRNK
jgi:hypothetical protein